MRACVLCVLLCGCGGCGSTPSTDAGPNDARGEDAPIDDAATRDGATRDGSVDSATDGSTADGAVDSTTPRRVVGPHEEEPPDTELEPGSDADHAYRYCWYLARIICDGAFNCCEIAAETIFENDYEQCLVGLDEGACSVYLEWPSAFGPYDVDELEENLDELAESVAECRDPGVKFGFVRGHLEEGEACNGYPGSDCRDGLYCVDDACREFSLEGESCAGDLQCDEPEIAYCSEEEVCVAWGETVFGESCTSDFDCASRRCTDEVCDTEGFTWCLGAD